MNRIVLFIFYIWFVSTSGLASEYRLIEAIGGNQLIGEINYKLNSDPLIVTQIDDVNCVLENRYVKTIHMQQQTNGFDKAYEFVCADGVENDETGKAFSPLVDAHIHGTTVMQMYQEWYQINPVEGQLTIKVHYGEKIGNAYWDTETKSMMFGDGDPLKGILPMTFLDVTAHEVSHEIIHRFSQLEDDGQAAAIAESFGDIAGEAAEFYATGACDFRFAAGATVSAPALRYLDSPTKDGRSIDHIKDYKKETDPLTCYFCEVSAGVDACKDSCGTKAHYASGILNKAFYLMSQTPGWDVKKAFDVFFYANQHLWKSSTRLRVAGIDLRAASEALGYEVSDVDFALKSVGL